VHGLLNGRNDVGVAAAATDIAAHQFANFVSRVGVARDQSDSRTDLARRAIAALKPVMVDEGLLQGMQQAVRGQPFDGRDFGTVLHDGEGQAGDDTPSVDQHGAGAASAVVAPLLCSGEIEIFTERIQQRCPGTNRQLSLNTVYMKRDVELRRQNNFVSVVPSNCRDIA
jgi:hypothetical protein